MSFGFGNQSGPGGLQPQLGQTAFGSSPRTLSPDPSNPFFSDSSTVPRFASPRASIQTSTPPFPNSSAAQRFPSPRAFLQTSTSHFPDSSTAPQYPSPRGSPQASTSFLDSSGAPRFSSPRPSSRPSAYPFSDHSAATRFPRSRTSYQPSIPHRPDYSADPQFVRPRLFAAEARSPSPTNTRLTSGSSQSSAGPSRASSLQSGDRQTSGPYGEPSQKRFMPHVAHDHGISVSSEFSPSQDLDRSRPPAVQYTDDSLTEPYNDAMEGNADNVSSHFGHAALQRQQPPSAVANNHSFMRPTALMNKSPRPSMSPSKLRREMGVASDPQFNQRSSPFTDGISGDTHLTRLPGHSLTKRTRSPPAAASQVSQLISVAPGNDFEREEQAKAKRLARFKTELNDVEPSNGSNAIQIGPSAVESKKLSVYRPPVSMDGLPHDYDEEGSQSSSIIVGLCPDMCPESERAERERKGDLDRYERLDGDRNQTSKILAVKKYNRTAEREAALIRPMPILQKTMDYLLGLLDQSYDERFLALYNFLWDRMRAIRMDLRMQHIFNLKAITMLEQMIRLHIIAMHELCEFSRGEGFSEGFDAHLNIEQMNKTSVELFQLYDDHRKKGIHIPTEKEFRGYYALLKLDKHPGYKVEPGELSLDLSQMTVEIRQTQEVLFARDVARSCRTGNFIAFFRHARIASYLQACLMHAHFSKLRTQALASLYSGLQYSQGLPVTHVAKWLGMEGEDVETLLGYHGFLIKEFEEPYLVKDGPFLNDDKDYPTRGSILVHEKKSSTIMEDILSSNLVMSPSESKFLKDRKNEPTRQHLVRPKIPCNVFVDEDVGIEAMSSPRSNFAVQPPIKRSSSEVQPLPESIIGQPFNDHQMVTAGSPRKPEFLIDFQSHRMQEQISPRTPESVSPVVDDGHSSQKSSPCSSSADQCVLVPQTSSLGFARQNSFKGSQTSSLGFARQDSSKGSQTSSLGFARQESFKGSRTFSSGLARQDSLKGPNFSSPETIVHSECNTMAPSFLSVDAREQMPSVPEFASVIVTSPRHSICMVDFAAEGTNMPEQVENDIATSTYDKEVAEAKLRLLLRLWRRRWARKKRLLQDNQLAADAAFNSLSLGLPLCQSEEKFVTSRKLDIDKALQERYQKWQQSWVRWNVSELVAATLSEKNANSICICWKVIAFSWLHPGSDDMEARGSETHVSLDEWLRYKFFADQKDKNVGGLVMSAPGLSVWRQWGCNSSGDTICNFSIIKDTSSNSGMKLFGASALVFPISDTVPWNSQKIRLHNIVMSLPSESRIPLLIIFGSGEDNFGEASSSIANKLGLEDLDKSRVATFLLVCLRDRDDSRQFQGYYSDQKLKEGLIWLASESHAQPVLSSVTTRELVSLHLNSCLDAANLMFSDRVAPNQCISAFNEAIDQTVVDIVDAAKANPTGWPCPEPFLLDESTAEFRVVKQFLPSLGWSLADEVDPFVASLRSCKLPYFPDDLSWLNKGCRTEEDIEDQRQLLQDCLIRYLTQTSNIMYLMMAEKEANLMVQNYTRLELHDTEYKMVPNWVLIFRRVFNWQLNNSACFTCKSYVLEQTQTTCNQRYLDKLKMEAHMPRHIAHPSLDEMVEVSCSPIASKRVRSSPKSLNNVAAMISDEDMARVPTTSHLVAENSHCPESQAQPVDDSDSHLIGSDLHLVPKDGNKAAKLDKLLDQCGILQAEIEKKLSIYF